MWSEQHCCILYGYIQTFCAEEYKKLVPIKSMEVHWNSTLFEIDWAIKLKLALMHFISRLDAWYSPTSTAKAGQVAWELRKRWELLEMDWEALAYLWRVLTVRDYLSRFHIWLILNSGFSWNHPQLFPVKHSNNISYIASLQVLRNKVAWSHRWPSNTIPIRWLQISWGMQSRACQAREVHHLHSHFKIHHPGCYTPPLHLLGPFLEPSSLHAWDGGSRTSFNVNWVQYLSREIFCWLAGYSKYWENCHKQAVSFLYRYSHHSNRQLIKIRTGPLLWSPRLPLPWWRCLRLVEIARNWVSHHFLHGQGCSSYPWGICACGMAFFEFTADHYQCTLSHDGWQRIHDDLHEGVAESRPWAWRRVSY